MASQRLRYWLDYLKRCNPGASSSDNTVRPKLRAYSPEYLTAVPSAYLEDESVEELPVEPVLPVDPLVPLEVPEELPAAEPVDPPGVAVLPMPEVLLRELFASEVLPGDRSPLQAVRASTPAARIA